MMRESKQSTTSALQQQLLALIWRIWKQSNSKEFIWWGSNDQANLGTDDDAHRFTLLIRESV